MAFSAAKLCTVGVMVLALDIRGNWFSTFQKSEKLGLDEGGWTLAVGKRFPQHEEMLKFR